MYDTPNFRLRPATAADLPEMTVLFSSVIETVCANDYSPEQCAAWAASSRDASRWQRLLVETEVVLAVAPDGRLAGFAALKHPSHIDMMYAGKDFQRTGVATLLLQHFLSKSVPPVTAHVSRTARPFFEKHGFRVTDVLFPERNGIVIPNFGMRKDG